MSPLWFGKVRIWFNGDNWTVDDGGCQSIRADHIKLDSLSAKSVILSGRAWFEVQWGIVTMLEDGVVEIS